MKTIVYIEKNPVSKQVRAVSKELVYKAYSLMKPYSGEVVGVFCGAQLPTDINNLFQVGLNRLIYHIEPRLEHLQSTAYQQSIQAMIKREQPEIVLFGATHTGRDVAPLIASALKTGLTADCTQLYIEQYKDSGDILYQVRPAFGGNILATIVTPDDRPMMATVREGVMPIMEQDLDHPVKTEAFEIELKAEWIRNEFLEVIPKKKSVDFAKSDIIVSGGAGVGSAEDFALIHKLATALGAEVGASRAAVDFGFAEKERQIGQTGSVVRPKLYIACGISGQIQHRAGMEEAKKIIAINNDPEAPIFNIAHKGIVGDLKEIIPIMLRYLKEED